MIGGNIPELNKKPVYLAKFPLRVICWAVKGRFPVIYPKYPEIYARYPEISVKFSCEYVREAWISSDVAQLVENELFGRESGVLLPK